MKISVILSYYNRPEMVAGAQMSVARQTHEDWQLIIVDDQSDYAPLLDVDPRVEIHRTTTNSADPRGPGRMASGINQAMKHVAGEIVCYLADDDFYHPDWLSHVADAFTYNSLVDVVWGRLRYTDAEGVPTGKERMPYGWEHPAKSLDHNQVAHRRKLNYGIVPPWPTNMDRLRRELDTDGPDAGFFYDLWNVTKQWLPIPWADAAFKRNHPHSMLIEGVENIGEVRE